MQNSNTNSGFWFEYWSNLIFCMDQSIISVILYGCVCKIQGTKCLSHWIILNGFIVAGIPFRMWMTFESEKFSKICDIWRRHIMQDTFISLLNIWVITSNKVEWKTKSCHCQCVSVGSINSSVSRRRSCSSISSRSFWLFWNSIREIWFIFIL